MQFIDWVLLVFSIITVISFVVTSIKTYSTSRLKEAERYFNGSIVDKNEHFKERTYTHGLALVKDKNSGTYKFKKQAKMCDTALLYS